MAGERLCCLMLLLLFSPQSGSAQDAIPKTPVPEQLIELKKLQAASDWEGILRRVPSDNGSVEECFYRGLALSRLQRWE